MRALAVETRRFPLAGAFTISRGARTEAVVVEARLSEGGATGRGECVPYARYGESVESVTDRIEGARARIEAGMDRDGLAAVLPAGAARNALDCALWDLAAKRAGRRVWQLAAWQSAGGSAEPGPELTAYTLSLDAPEAMRAQAAEHAHRPLLKIKLGGAGDLDRLRAVRAGAPAARLIVDANEGWDAGTYAALAPELVALGVEMVEQPLPAGADAALADMARPLPVCADEACHDRESLDGLAGRYDMINIKLDKTGGLTEALALRRAAEARGSRHHGGLHDRLVAGDGAGEPAGAGRGDHRSRRALAAVRGPAGSHARRRGGHPPARARALGMIGARPRAGRPTPRPRRSDRGAGRRIWGGLPGAPSRRRPAARPRPPAGGRRPCAGTGRESASRRQPCARIAHARERGEGGPRTPPHASREETAP